MGAELELTSVSLPALYEELLPTVYRMAYSCLREHRDSEDVAREAFLRLARSGKRFADKRELELWLIVTAAELSRDLLRRKRRARPTESSRSAPAAERTRARDLREAIWALPEKYKLPLYLHDYAGYSVSEIARALHRGENTVETWLSRGRQRLRESPGEDRGDETSGKGGTVR